MEIDQTTRSRLIAVLGGLIFLQACLGVYFLIKADTTSANISFSTLAALAGSMAALSAGTENEHNRFSGPSTDQPMCINVFSPRRRP